MKKLVVVMVCMCLSLGNMADVLAAGNVTTSVTAKVLQDEADEAVMMESATEQEVETSETEVISEQETEQFETEVVTEQETEQLGEEEQETEAGEQETETTECVEPESEQETECDEKIVKSKKEKKLDEKQEKVSQDTEEFESTGVSSKLVTITVAGETFEIDPKAARYGLQKVFDYINSCNLDGNKEVIVVNLPAGEYKIEQSLDIYSNTKLDLSDGAVLKRDTQSALIRFGRAEEETKGYNGFHNISIIGGTLDGNSGTTSIVRFAHSSNITFEKVHFTNVKKAHHMEFAGSKNIRIDSCIFDGFEPRNLKSNTNYEAIQIDILQEGHFPNYGSYDGTLSSGITIINNTFKGLNRGVGCHSAEIGRYFEDINISQNTFDDITGYAIVATNFRNSVINNNAIKNAGAGIYFRHITPDYVNYYSGKASGVTTDVNSQIKGNTVSLKKTAYANTPYAISVYGEKVSKTIKKSYKDDDTGKKITVRILKGDYRVKNLSISGNKINIQTTGYGIWLRGVYGSSLDKNKIIYKITKKSNNECDGIRLENSTKNKITNNSIADNSKTVLLRDGIYVKIQSSDNKLEKNTITNVKENGIYISESKGCTLKGNKINKTSKHGIYVDQKAGTSSKPAIIDGNTISGVGARGICINDKTYANVIKNTVKKTKNEAIYFGEKSEGNVTNNVITDSKAQGIYINTKSKAKSIAGNKISICKENGIYVNASAKANNIKKNSIYDVKKHGIYVHDTVVGTITDNTIGKKKEKKSCVRGICVNGSRASVTTISGNKISKCKEKGIVINEGAKVKKLAKNKVK